MARAKRVRMTPEAFWAKVAQGDSAQCWEWTGRRHESYGTVTWCGVEMKAHRVAWSLVNGPIPAGGVIMHACDNPPCCNPGHLSLGTRADNNADMKAKGRARSGALLHIGEANHKAKLTAPIVVELRAAWRSGESIKSIVRRTGLSVGTIHPMLHGQTWRHVEVRS